jgi:cellulose synthase/poly-beta-1,6-N-acetylglucosamine synthase-like glycosyltransferase
MLATLLVTLYFAVFALLCCYGMHRARLFYLCLKHKRRIAAAARTIPVAESDLPLVTIQLPLYNEATVAGRLLDAVGRIDYPKDRFEIQVLDDSTDETRAICAAKVSELRARGIDAHHIRRPSRIGYKAGALDYGLKFAKGELAAIFDADFLPQPSFLRDVVGHFVKDPRIAVVQTRWHHLNRHQSFLTGIQALMLDGHHLVENRARFGADCLWNFSGTGGVWRRMAIDDAGGWQHDTIAEDLDLSYRAQMRGWKFLYRPDVATPSELPETMTALRAQQFRWAKGTVQCCRKLFWKVMRAPLRVDQKIEAFFHLTPHFGYPLIMALTVLLLPTVAFMPASDWRQMLLVDLPICAASTGSIVMFYGMAERAQGRSIWSALIRLPGLFAINAGLSPNQTRAVWSGLREMHGEFVRTPKKGNSAGRYALVSDLPLAEFGLGILTIITCVTAVRHGHYFAAPFAAVFAVGYLYTALLVVSEQAAHRRSRDSVPAPAEVGTSSVARAA